MESSAFIYIVALVAVVAIVALFFGRHLHMRHGASSVEVGPEERADKEDVAGPGKRA